jgi:hypothetical protein
MSRSVFLILVAAALACCGGDDGPTGGDAGSAPDGSAPFDAPAATDAQSAGGSTGSPDAAAAGAPDSGGTAANNCGPMAWYCLGNPPSPGAEPLTCSEAGPGPVLSGEALARSNCRDRAMKGNCPTAGFAGACIRTQGGHCMADYYRSDPQGTAARTCAMLGRWITF